MIEILNQLIYFAFFQGLFLVIAFGVSHKKREQINVYLLILILVLMTGLIVKLGHFALGWERQIKGIAEFSVLLFGPTLYLFVLSTLSEKQFQTTDLLHYIPAVVHSFIVTFYYILPPNEVILERIETGELYRVVHILVGVTLTINCTYFVMSVLKFKNLKEALQNEASYILNVNFVQNFLIAIGICLLTWVVVYFISFGNNGEIEIVLYFTFVQLYLP